jgi:hypothetical protein
MTGRLVFIQFGFPDYGEAHRALRYNGLSLYELGRLDYQYGLHQNWHHCSLHYPQPSVPALYNLVCLVLILIGRVGLA